MAEIASRWSAIIDETGPDAILNAHYTGTCSVIAYAFGSRFFRRLGATEVDPDSVCNKAGHVALDYMYGSSVTGFDPRSARDAACIMVWGANPSASAPHAHDHWLPEAPGTVIVIDSIRTPTAQQADLHLQPFPGSDAALAFAMLHVIVRDGLADRELLERHAIGWDELEPQLEACTPEWAEPVTGVPAQLIERAAAIYGRGPSLLWIGQGLQRQSTGGNVMRAVALLPAVSGNLAKPGAGFLYLNDRARDRRGLAGGAAAGRSAGADQPHGPGRTPRGSGAQPQPVLLEHQHRRVQPRADQAAGRARPRATCSRWWSTCSRRTRATTPTCCCRRPASWSSTTWSRRTSICRCRHR